MYAQARQLVDAYGYILDANCWTRGGTASDAFIHDFAMQEFTHACNFAAKAVI